MYGFSNSLLNSTSVSGRVCEFLLYFVKIYSKSDVDQIAENKWVTLFSLWGSDVKKEMEKLQREAGKESQIKFLKYKLNYPFNLKYSNFSIPLRLGSFAVLVC